MNEQCHRYRGWIPRALLGDLEPSLKAELDEHLASCETCQRERDEYLLTVQELSSVQEVDVPRHFLLGPEAARPGVLELLAGLRWPWTTVAVSLALAFTLIVGGAASGAQFRAENGIYAFSFGRAIPELGDSAAQEAELQALRAELQSFVQERTQAERQVYEAALRSQLDRSARTLTPEQRSILAAEVAQVEARMSAAFLAGQELARKQTREALVAVYDAVQAQRVEDLLRIRHTMSQAALENEAKNRQTEEVLSTLLEVADLQSGRLN